MYIILFIIFLLVLILFLYKRKEFFTEIKNKYVCMYAYYEKNENYKNNLIYFLNNKGILDHVDYYFIVNGNSTIDFPKRKNIKVIYRNNKGYDFGAWSHIIEQYLYNLDYEYYIFINSSVEGPHIPENSNKNWLELFLELFNNKDVKMVGSTINILEIDVFNLINFEFELPYTHIQSMFFILDKEAMTYLNNKHFFNEQKINKMNHIVQMIIHYEITLSQLILKNNWNINCIVPYYKNLDYRKVKKNINKTDYDVLYKNAFFGRTLLPTEVIFYKKYRFE